MPKKAKAEGDVLQLETTRWERLICGISRILRPTPRALSRWASRRQPPCILQHHVVEQILHSAAHSIAHRSANRYESDDLTPICGTSAFGVHRPVLLLSAGITDRLTLPQLKAIVAHELCHIRRLDNLTAAIHMAIEAPFWFHPWCGGWERG